MQQVSRAFIMSFCNSYFFFKYILWKENGGKERLWSNYIYGGYKIIKIYINKLPCAFCLIFYSLKQKKKNYNG